MCLVNTIEVCLFIAIMGGLNKNELSMAHKCIEKYVSLFRQLWTFMLNKLRVSECKERKITQSGNRTLR